MDDTNIVIYPSRSPWQRHVELMVIAEPFTINGEPQSPRKYLKSMAFEKCKTGQYIEPAFKLSEENTQQLFDELWRQGFRPKDGTGNGGHIEALKYHLEDMRGLVFKKGKQA